MKKVWYIDMDQLVHNIEFEMYEKENIEWRLSSNLKEVEKDYEEFGKFAEVVVVQASFIIDEKFLSKMPELKGICTIGMGYNNVDIIAAKKRNITVSNVPDYSTNEVADHTITLALAAIRDIRRFDYEVRSNIWNPTMRGPIRRLSEMTYGLIGFGKIAQEVAKRLKAFGFKIISFDKYAPTHHFQELGVKSVSLEELLSQSDVISLHVPLTKETENLINEKTIEQMKENMILVNTSRGGVVDEKSLFNGIKEGKINRGALDVLVEEPPKINHSLVNCEELLITPHVAYLSVEAEIELQTKTASNVIKILNGKRPNYIVNE